MYQRRARGEEENRLLMRFFKRKIVWMPLAGIVVIALIFSFFRGASDQKKLAFSDVVELGRAGKLKSIEVRGSTLAVRVRDAETAYESQVGSDTDVTQALQSAGVVVGGDKPGSVMVSYDSPSPGWFSWVFWIGMLGIFGLLIYFAVLFALRRARREEHAQ